MHQVLAVMVTVWKRFLAVTNDVGIVNDLWPAVILSAGYTEMISINRIYLVSKYGSQCKGQSHWLINLQSTVVVYIMVYNHLSFLMFFISCYSLILGFSCHFLKNISGNTYNRFQGIFYIPHIKFCYF